jgi:large subunit ribosomal protein LP1
LAARKVHEVTGRVVPEQFVRHIRFAIGLSWKLQWRLSFKYRDSPPGDSACVAYRFGSAVKPDSGTMTSALAVVYAALILHDDGIAIGSDKIHRLLSAAGVTTVDGYWIDLFADYFKNNPIENLIKGTPLGGASPAPAAPPPPAAPLPPADSRAPADAPPEEKKENRGEQLADAVRHFSEFFG